MGAYAGANNGHLPKTIVVYRAGLNRSQQVLKEADDYITELDRMWETNAAGVPKPCITVIHTSKRSAIRLFKRQGSGAHDNCGAGTVIDEGITSPNVFDFELVANNTKYAGRCFDLNVFATVFSVHLLRRLTQHLAAKS